MEFTVITAYNGSEEIAAAGQYGESIRVTNMGLVCDPSTPREDIWQGQVMLNWTRASNASIGGAAWSYMSATCYLFARNLHDLVAGTPNARPFGLIASTWGGTFLEDWMDAAAFAQTGEAYSYFKNFGVPNAYPSALWNAMFNPLTNHTIDSIVWYQGEQNVVYSARNYSLNEPIMVNSWRQVFSTKTQTSPQLPFGFEQLAGWTNETLLVNQTQNIAELRFAQNGGINFAVPNSVLGPSFRANAYDLADPVTPVNPPPYGDVHPRYKEQVGYRLAIAALPVLFPGAAGARIAPYFTNCSVGQNSITTTYTNGGDLNLYWNTNAWIPGFDVRDATHTWYNTTITAVAGDSVSVAIPTNATRPITGVRFAWQVCCGSCGGSRPEMTVRQ
jgi:sialate O-acetylesterase